MDRRGGEDRPRPVPGLRTVGGGPDEPGTSLTFKALQTYDDGEVVRWIGAPDADEPAPR